MDTSHLPETELTCPRLQYGLPTVDYFEMYLTLMSSDTGNEVCDRLGIWARERGFDALIYSTARYGQQGGKAAAERDGKKPVPALSFVPLGTSVCEGELEPAGWFNNMLYAHMSGAGGPEQFAPIFAEPNLVLFSNAQIQAFDRAVFYWTFPADRSLFPRLDNPDGCREERGTVLRVL